MKGMWIHVVLVSAALGTGLPGCGGDDGTGGSGASGGGGSGGSGGAGGGPGGGTTSSTTGSTTSTTTTGSTTTAPPDPCEGVIGAFTPEWKPSEGTHQGLCADAAQINAFFAACLEGGATEADCNAFVDASTGNADCVSCALSAPEDPEYGPMTIYEMPAVLYENPGQCISEVEGDASDASCGAKVFFTIQCQVSACAQCDYGTDFNVLLKCLDAAKAGSCAPYADAEAACVANLKQQGVNIDVCLPPTSGGNAAFYQYLKDLTLFHCGP